MAKDIIHDAIKNALVNDGWIITDDPLHLKYKDIQVFVDLGAERVIGAERNGEKIAVEIKSFVSPSAMRDIEVAIGQYAVYLSFLKRIDPTRKLFLGISKPTFKTIFRSEAIQMLVSDYHLSLLVVDIKQEKVIEWIIN